MAELTDGIGDFQAQINTASQDRIPALMDGLQGLVAVAQGRYWNTCYIWS